VVAVVPPADFVPVQPLGFRGEHGVEIAVRVSADRCQRKIEADVVKVVDARRETRLREHHDAGDEGQADVFFGCAQPGQGFRGTEWELQGSDWPDPSGRIPCLGRGVLAAVNGWFTGPLQTEGFQGSQNAFRQFQQLNEDGSIQRLAHFITICFIGG